MIVITWIFTAEADKKHPLTFEQLERACESDDEETGRELIGLYEGKNRVLPIE
jgi:hypothetical protein